jgi:hypothetical protein
MSEQPMTDRMVAAMANPNSDILGHCTGRMVLGKGRPESTFDADLVFGVCKHFDKAVEINCRPERLDPPMRLLEQVVATGCKVSIDSDAHAVGQLEWQPYGCARAAEAGVAPDDIVNAWPPCGSSPGPLPTGDRLSAEFAPEPGRAGPARIVTMTTLAPAADPRWLAVLAREPRRLRLRGPDHPHLLPPVVPQPPPSAERALLPLESRRNARDSVPVAAAAPTRRRPIPVSTGSSARCGVDRPRRRCPVTR